MLFLTYSLAGDSFQNKEGEVEFFFLNQKNLA